MKTFLEFLLSKKKAIQNEHDWNMPSGILSSRVQEVDHRCPLCKHRWVAKMRDEYGQSVYVNPQSEYCPKCGEEGIIVS